MTRFHGPASPFWPTVWHNRRPVALGAAAFAATSLGAAVVAVPAFKLIGAVLLAVYLLSGGQ